MERIRALARQVLPSPASAQAASPVSAVDPQKANRPPQLSPEALTRLLKLAQEFREDADRLESEGRLPRMSVWDIQVATHHELTIPSEADVGRMLDSALKKDHLRVLDLLPGPWRDAKTREERIRLCREVSYAASTGSDIFLYSKWQLQYGDRGLSSNIAFPVAQVQGTGSRTKVWMVPRVLLADAEDAQRISHLHVRKEGNFEQALFGSIISTPDNDHWRKQRQHLSEAFMPLSSLAKILPVSRARAKSCAERLEAPARAGTPVDMSDFLLHEAQAQLQLALLGAPEELMNATNADIRATFSGDIEPDRIGALGKAMQDLMKLAREGHDLGLPTDGCPIRGPLSRAVQTSGMDPATDYGNMLLILFAGHDTTGHTMTWMLFELARHPELQQELRAEVDAFFASLGGRDPEYADLGKGLELMDLCVTETLRLWPAVASGTYRQLQFDDAVRGAGGAQVELPKGTRVQIVNWSRHRNPELWGPDADEFNPRRNFRSEELARVGCPMAAATPQSERFSPFAHTPRSCLGRNFAQMEIRLIMLNLLRRFEFSLAPPYDKLMSARTGPAPSVEDFRGVNRATMGPMDLERSTVHNWGKRHLYAMKMHLRPRT